MQAVYGWVPIVNRGCTGLDLKTNVTAYQNAALAYCRLQYNYVTLPANQKAVYTFNPFTALIHAPYSPILGGGLDSSAYAFSIDDKLSFKSVVADGIILTIAGTKGLEFDRKIRPDNAGANADPDNRTKRSSTIASWIDGLSRSGRQAHRRDAPFDRRSRPSGGS